MYGGYKGRAAVETIAAGRGESVKLGRYRLLVKSQAFERVVEAGGTMAVLGTEGLVEATDRLGERGGLRLVAVLLAEVLAVQDCIRITAGEDVGCGVVGVVGIFLQDGVDVQDELADSDDGELAAFGLDLFGLFQSVRKDGCDL